MMAFQNIVLVGGTGNIGSPVLTQLRSAIPKFTITILSRVTSTATFPSDVRVIKVDYDDVSSLTHALQGQDAIVSTIGTAALDDAQMNLVTAAVSAGIKLFIPSEFGVDSTHPVAVELKVFDVKVQLVQELQKVKLPYTVIYTGPFLDWGIENGYLGINIKKRTVDLIDDGHIKVSGTSVESIGKAVVAVLQNPDKFTNRRIAVSDTVFTQNELLMEVQKHVGNDGWTVSHTPLNQLKKAGFAKLMERSCYGHYFLIKAAIFSGTTACYWTPDRDQTKELGVKQRSLQEIVSQVVSELE